MSHKTLGNWAWELGVKKEKDTGYPKLILNNIPNDVSFEELLASMKSANDIVKKLVHKTTQASASIETSNPVMIVFSSDWHLGGIGTDYNAFEKDIYTIKNTPNLFVYLGGDYMDNYIQASKMQASMNQEGIARQRTLTLGAIDLIKDKIIALGTSCHQIWNEKLTGIDEVASWAKNIKVLYTGYGGTLNLKVGTQEYEIFRRHKYRFNSQYNVTHSVKQLLRMGLSDADVLVLEHWHVPAKEEFFWKDRKRIAIRTGSYKIYDEFASENGLFGAQSAAPTIILWPNEKKIIAFLDMYDAIECMKGLIK